MINFAFFSCIGEMKTCHVRPVLNAMEDNSVVCFVVDMKMTLRYKSKHVLTICVSVFRQYFLSDRRNLAVLSWLSEQFVRCFVCLSS